MAEKGKCPECGCKVVLPCRGCTTKKRRRVNGYGPDDKNLKLELELEGDQLALYKQIRHTSPEQDAKRTPSIK